MSLAIDSRALAAEAKVPPPPPVDVAPESGELAEEPSGGAGVSPVELIPRIEIRQTFRQLENNVSVHTTTAEVDVQFVDRVLLRYLAPLQIVKTPDGQISGAGDLQIQAITILSSDARYALATITGAVLDTATQTPLGAGKQQLVLGGGAAIKPYRRWLAYAIVQEQFSIAGSSARPDVNQLFARAGNVIFGKRFNWFKLDLDTAVDLRSGAGRFFGALEAGSLLIGRVGLFVNSGTQLLGKPQLDYFVEAGVRYLFRLEKHK